MKLHQMLLVASTAAILIVLLTLKAPEGLPSCLPSNREPALLISIVDGDTIKVMLEDGTVSTVRYIGIDTPERNEPRFALATQKNIELLTNSTITLIRDVSEVDKYGRLLRYVLADNTDVGRNLLQHGYAQLMTIPPDVACSSQYAQIVK